MRISAGNGVGMADPRSPGESPGDITCAAAPTARDALAKSGGRVPQNNGATVTFAATHNAGTGAHGWRVTRWAGKWIKSCLRRVEAACLYAERSEVAVEVHVQPFAARAPWHAWPLANESDSRRRHAVGRDAPSDPNRAP